MKKLLIITLLIKSVFLFGQDTIRSISGEIIIGNVIEVNKEEIKYKKSSNINGPAYLLSKTEIISITYLNGEIEIYSKSKENPFSEDDSDLFEQITKKNKVVYIDSGNENAIIHATNAIERWGFWGIAQNKEDADFILKFNIRFAGLGDAFGSAQFIYPKNNKILKTTKEVNTIMGWDLNTKRGVINKIVTKELKPLFNNR